MKIHFCTPLLVVSLLFSTAVLAQAPVNPALTDTHTFTLGVYAQSSDIKIGSTLSGQPKRELDQDRLGLDDTYVSYLAAYLWRFGERWSMELSGFSFSTQGSRSVSETFTFGGQEFEAGASLESDFSVDALLLDVFYSVYKSDTAELRIGGGLHAFDFEVELAADAFIGDASASRVAADEQLLAPLPNLRFDGLYALSPRWSVSGGMGWLSVTYDDYEGSYVFADIKTDYRITDGFSLGIGYRLVDTDIKAEGSRRDLSFNSEYHGPTAYLSYSF